MDNIESVIYTNKIINLLANDDFFNPNINPFMDEELLYNKILEQSIKNFNDFEIVEITAEQLEEFIDAVNRQIIGETFEEMVEDGLIEPQAIDAEGDLLYGINQEVRDEFEKNFKKNNPET